MTDSARLDRSVLPVRYDLLVETDAAMTAFTGQVGIGLEVMETTSTIVLHAKDLDVTLESLSQGDQPLAAELTLEPATERIVVRTGGPLAEGPARLVAPIRRRRQPGPARLLPQHLRRRDRRRTGPRRDPIRGAARAARVSLLRRARVQGDLRDHARRCRRAARDLERSRDRPRVVGRRSACASVSARRSRCRPTSSRGSSVRSS